MCPDDLPSHSEPPELEDGGPRLSSRQQELWEELTSLDSELGGLYREGIALSRRVEKPGVGHLLAHVGRELTLGVLSALVEEGYQLSEKELEEIDEDESHRAKIAQCLGLRQSDPQVSQWLELHNFFTTAVHHRRSQKPPDPLALRVNFERLDRLLFGLVGPYFKTQAKLAEFLSIEEPTPEDLAKLREFLSRRQARRYFYQKLSSVAWLRLLAEAEVFNHPPELIEGPNGALRTVPWPEGEFLARVAQEEAELVVEVLENLPTSIRNPAVWHVVAKVGLQVHPDLARRLVPPLLTGIGNITPVVFADELLILIPLLADAGHSEAFEIAKALLFVPNATEIGEASPYSMRSDWLFPRLRWLEFSGFSEGALRSLEKYDRERTLVLLLGKVREVAGVFRKLGVSFLSRRWLEGPHPSDPDDFAGQLIASTIDVLSRFGASGRDEAHHAIELLRQYEEEVFKRLEYRLLAAAGQFLEEELDSFFSSSMAVEPGEWGREVALVLREQYRNASSFAQDIFRYALERGPDPESVTDWLRIRGAESPRSEDIDAERQRWQRKRLTWFRGEIPGELQALAETLGVWDKKPTIEEQELAEVGHYSTAGATWGEPTPITSQDLTSQSVDQIVHLITTWEPDDRSFETGTLRGLESSLQEMAASDPPKALDLWELAGQQIPFGFVRGLMDGLRDSLRGEAERFDWERSLQFVNDVVEVVTGTSDDRLSERRNLLRSAIDLLEQGVRADLIPPSLEESVWSALRIAVSDPLAWDEKEEDFESFRQVLGASLNRVAPRTIYAALQGGLWSFRLRESENVTGATNHLEKKLTPLLDETLERTGPSRIVVEAVIGRFLPYIQLITPAWFESHVSGLLEAGATDTIDHPAWGAYITGGRFYESTFQALRPWYVEAATVAATNDGTSEGEDDQWSLARSLVDHVVIAVVRGVAAVGDLDGIVEKTFANVPVKHRSHAHWAMFRRWMDAKEPPPETFVENLLDLWKWRLDQLEQTEDPETVGEEVRGLSWYLRIPYLPASAVLNLGLRTATLSEGWLDGHTDWGRLRALGNVEPDTAFAIAELLAVAQLSEPYPYIPVDEVMLFLETVLEQGNDETQKRARRLVHRLGEAGYDGFRELLDDL